MLDPEKYWNLSDEERRNLIVDIASKRITYGAPDEDLPDFLLMDRLAVEVARLMRENRALKEQIDEP